MYQTLLKALFMASSSMDLFSTFARLIIRCILTISVGFATCSPKKSYCEILLGIVESFKGQRKQKKINLPFRCTAVQIEFH